MCIPQRPDKAEWRKEKIVTKGVKKVAVSDAGKEGEEMYKELAGIESKI